MCSSPSPAARPTASNLSGRRSPPAPPPSSPNGGRDAPLPTHVAFVRVGNARRALALVAAKFYPRQPQNHRRRHRHQRQDLRRRLHAADLDARLAISAASIGTVGIVSPRGETYGSLTTPDPVALHRSIDTLAGEGVTHLADRSVLAWARSISARRSAHRGRRLHQHHRAIISTIIRASKPISPPSCGCSRSWSSPARAAVIDVDHDHADAVVAAAKARGLSIISVGRSGDGIRLVEADIDGFAQTLRIEHGGKKFRRASAAGRRVSGRERAGRRRTCHRDRQRSRPRCLPALEHLDRRQGPPRAGRLKPRRADLRRLCA